MKNKTERDYQKIAEVMSAELRKNKDDWQKRYGDYISVIHDNRKIVADVVKTLFQEYPIKIYLPLSGINRKKISTDQCITFDVRYMGNKLGTVVANLEQAKFYPIKKKDMTALVSDVGAFNNMSGNAWNKDLYIKICQILKPEIRIEREHQFESFLLDNFAKSRYKGKILPWSRPISWDYKNTCCFQMPTTWKGSELSKKAYANEELIELIENGKFWGTDSFGGGIDILARRSKGGNTTRLSIMELKNPDKSYSEDNIVLQALAYSVFVRELIKSTNARGDLWWDLFMDGRKAKSTKIKLEAIVVLSEKERNGLPAFKNTKIILGSDIIELNYLYLKEDNEGHWEYSDSSLEIWSKRKN